MKIQQLDPSFFAEGKWKDCKPKVKQLFAIGDTTLLQRKILGIVGPRIMSSYAGQVLESFFPKTQGKQIITISGGAKGVDQKCHLLSLAYQIPTIAVLGGGINYYLKRADRQRLEKINEAWGLILSEFDPDFIPTSWSFPLRNRIIAALSDILFLPEAREGSGSLITINYALKIKKTVFIAPNPLFSTNGEGSNQLLSEGKGQLLLDFSQITHHFEGQNTNQTEKESEIINVLTPEEKQVLSLIKQYDNQELSSRIEASNSEFGEVMTQITLLEMKGIIRQTRPGIYTAI